MASNADQHAHADSLWHVFVDTGGTFTDCLAIDPNGAAHRAKVLSSGVVRGAVERAVAKNAFALRPTGAVDVELLQGWGVATANGNALGTVTRVDAARQIIEIDGDVQGIAPGSLVDFATGEEAPVLAVRLLTRTPLGQALPGVAMRLATTRGTNALLERRGVPTALFVTRGFGDLLAIGDQSRPELFVLNIIKPAPPCAVTVEVDERLDAAGNVLVPMQLENIEKTAAELLSQGITSAAIALMHSYVNSEHEQQLAATLRELGFVHVSVSSELAPLIKILPRAQTAAVDATLGPIVQRYVERVQSALGESELKMMSSAGGLTPSGQFRAKDGLLSGPAGGVIGALAAAKRSGFTKVISFDMGGTSTDVARLDGEPDYRTEHDVGGVRVFAPALAIETVAAGGGSICDFQLDVLSVGPASAGASPGPACYGVGGPLTMTDVNLLLGRIAPGMFEIPVSVEAAENALEALRDRIAKRTGQRPERKALLEGFRSVANQTMAEGITRVSVRHGYDPAECALVAFGGAGAQHACAIADLLGMRTIIVPAEASLLSALGLAHARQERVAQQQMLQRLDACAARLRDVFAALESQAKAELVDGEVTCRRFADVRLLGQETVLTIECDDEAHIAGRFREAYRAMYGHAPAGKSIEVVSLRVMASQAGREWQRLDRGLGACAIERTVDGRPVRDGDALRGGMIVAGAKTCCAIDDGWAGTVDEHGAIVLRRDIADAVPSGAKTSGLAADALVANRLGSIAQTMGEQLRRTAVSTNVKERLDFSCAITDAKGALVISAPHIPVHLGAAGHCVRAVIAQWKSRGRTFRAGDVVVTNHPAFGGSHLPDVTTVTPVFDAAEQLVAFTLSRAHHAEIGGKRPGSMPARATRLVEEGVVIEPTLLVDAGAERFDELERTLRSAAFPSRAVDDNLADLRAAVAANHRGAALLSELANELGTAALQQHMRALMDRSERLVREAIGKLDIHACEARDAMDDGSPICVRVSEVEDALTIDFTGSAVVHAGNLNATPAIVHSAVMYVMRLLVDEAVPLNDGLMRAVRLILPGGMLNPKFDGALEDLPAVVGGNVETSQRVVDVLLTALGKSACSQGTMNNTLFGTDTWAYYETICGGAAAGPGFNGASAVHTHMTNTRITDPEILERRYPVRLDRFAIRKGSGGTGAQRGGDGVVREMTFLEPTKLSMLTQRRTLPPCGAHGGQAGARGAQRVIRADGRIENLASIDDCELMPGDRLIIETPGGGGWGDAAANDKSS